jgi:AraC-like DNA-binding protein
VRQELRPPLTVDNEVESQLLDSQTTDGWEARALLAFAFSWDDWPAPRHLNGHVHGGMEVSVVLTGAIHLYFISEEFACGPGELWVCGMWEPHEWRIAETRTTSISLIFTPSLFDDSAQGDPSYLELLSGEASHHKTASGVRARERILALGHDIEQEIRRQEAFWKSMVRLDLLRLLGELSRSTAAAHSGSRRTSDQGTGDLARIMPAVKLAHGAEGRRVGVQSAAEACALSRSQFQRVFRRAMGVSYGKFCLRIRLGFATRQVLHTDRTLSAIADEAGFVDVSHLVKMFHKHYGCTPAEYRARHSIRLL